MRKILIILGLILCGSALFGQSPRIRLNQITKDSLTGSVVLSGSDSNMVYSRDFFLNLTDSVLILFGDTLSTTATAFTGVATDLTLTGNGTVGNELKVDTSVIATVSALSDSLAGIISSVTTDLTLTGDGSIATPLKVDTAIIATIRALSDSLATLSFATNQDISDSLATLSFASLQDITDTLDLNTRDYITGLRLTDTLNLNSRGFLTQNQTITLTDDATGTGTTSISITVVDDSHNHTITTLTGIQDSLNSKAALVHTHTISDVAFLQDSLDAKANDSDLNNYLLTSNYIVDSTRINLTGDTAYYYQNGVLIGTGAIAGGGGGGSGTVTDITAGTFLSGGTITTSGTIALDTASAGLKTYISENIGTVDLTSQVTGTLPVANGGTGAITLTSGAFLKGNGTSAVSGSSNLTETADTVYVAKFLNVDNSTLYVDAVNNRVGIGTNNPTVSLQVDKQIIAGNVDSNDYDNITTNPGFHIGVVDPTAASRAMNLVHYGGTTPTASALFRLRRSRGTSVGDYTKVEDGDLLGVFQWMYSNGTGWGTGGGFRMEMDGATGTGDFPTRILFRTTTDGTASVTEKMRLNNAGELLIGYTADQGAYKLQVNSQIFATNATIATSDIKYKTNINDLDSSLNLLMELKPKTYDFKLDPIHNFPIETQVGFIAQDVESVLSAKPYLGSIIYQNNGYKGMAYEKLIPITVKAIQEQQTIIESQQQEIETLKTQYNDLLQRIINLENK